MLLPDLADPGLGKHVGQVSSLGPSAYAKELTERWSVCVISLLSALLIWSPDDAILSSSWGPTHLPEHMLALVIESPLLTPLNHS